MKKQEKYKLSNFGLRLVRPLHFGCMIDMFLECRGIFYTCLISIS